MIGLRKLALVLAVVCTLYLGLISLLQFNIHADQAQGYLPKSILSKNTPSTYFHKLYRGFMRANLNVGRSDHVYTVNTPRTSPKSSTVLTGGPYDANLEFNGLQTGKQLQKHQYTILQTLEWKNLQHPDTSALEQGVNPEVNGRVISESTVDFIPLGDDFYVYGVFWDMRYPPNRYIRILTIRTWHSKTRRLACQFHATQNNSVNSVAEAYEMCENHGKKYGGWIYSCVFPDNLNTSTIPDTVTLKSFSARGEKLAVLGSLKIQRTGNPLFPVNSFLLKRLDDSQEMIPPQKDSLAFETYVRFGTSSVKNQPDMNRVNKETVRLGVCVPPLYGVISLQKIINFIEFCRLLGADKILLYVHDISPDIMTFFLRSKAVDVSLLSLVRWNLPKLQTSHSAPLSDQLLWNHGQLPAVQHCLYTNMAHYDWLLFIDIDEMLVPQNTYTWKELIAQTIDQFYNEFHRKSISGISFESAFFSQDFQSQTTSSIEYFQFLYRTTHTSGHRPKLFVRPSLVFEMGIHHLSKPVSQHLQIIRAHKGLALLHHYRQCVPGEGEDRWACEQQLVKDETILKYEVPLTAASLAKFKEAMEFFSSPKIAGLDPTV